MALSICSFSMTSGGRKRTTFLPASREEHASIHGFDQYVEDVKSQFDSEHKSQAADLFNYPVLALQLDELFLEVFSLNGCSLR